MNRAKRMSETSKKRREQPVGLHNDLSESELIHRIIGGEKHLFEIIMRRYNQRLFRIARSYVGDDDEAEDVLQESYIKAFENLPRFKMESGLSTWLIRILINESLARKRHFKKVQYVSPLLSEKGENNMHYYSEPSLEKTPEQAAINNELRKHLEDAISKLPEKYRIVYMMREVEEISIRETSECLNISESNVKVRLNRAKTLLKEKLTSVYRGINAFEFLGERCDRLVNNVMRRLDLS